MDSCAITPMASLLDYIQLLIISWAIQAMKVAQNVKKWLSKWSKNEMLVFRLCSTSEEWPSNLSNKKCPKWSKNGCQNGQKMKHSFLDYVQLLRSGQAIWVTKVAQNMTKWLPKWSKNEMLIFGLCSTSDDRPSDLSNESQQKCEKRPPKSLKNEMLIFGLCSTSDDPLSDLSEESQLKCKTMPPKSSKNEMLIFGLCSTSHDSPSNLSEESQLKCEKGPLSHWKMKCSFLDYVQPLVIWAILVKKVNWNAKQCPLSHWKMPCSFLDYIQLLMIGWVIQAMEVDWNAKKKPPKSSKN